MHPALRRTDHRPWALPQRPWSWRQSWCDLLFAHWPISADVLRPLVPASLVVQEFEGTSWLGVVPFQMRGVMRRPLPDLPWISAFPEVNLRLYVEYDGKAGVFFLSLDASNPLAVWAGRTLFHLPYVRAKMSVDIAPDGVRYRSVRAGSGESVVFDAVYHAIGAPYEAQPGSLEHWLTERYCLYTQARNGTLYRGQVHHAPWPLQAATWDLHENDLLAPHGLHVDDPPALLHFARRLDVVLWSLERLS